MSARDMQCNEKDFFITFLLQLLWFNSVASFALGDKMRDKTLARLLT